MRNFFCCKRAWSAKFERKFVRPGNDSFFIYNKAAGEIRDMLGSRKLKQSGLWAENLSDLFEEDFKSRNVDSAFTWFRFFVLSKVAQT